MSYEEFVELVLKDIDGLECPFDGIWCERSTCKDCKRMRKEYEKRWGEQK